MPLTPLLARLDATRVIGSRHVAAARGVAAHHRLAARRAGTDQLELYPLFRFGFRTLAHRQAVVIHLDPDSDRGGALHRERAGVQRRGSRFGAWFGRRRRIGGVSGQTAGGPWETSIYGQRE